MNGALGIPPPPIPLLPGGSAGLNLPPPKSRLTPKRISMSFEDSTRPAKLKIGFLSPSMWLSIDFSGGLIVR